MRDLMEHLPPHVQAYVDRNDFEEVAQKWLEYYSGWKFERWDTVDQTDGCYATPPGEKEEFFYY